MDDKAITAVSTSLALMQIQVNALVLLLEQQLGVSVKEDFQRLISEGVQAVGLEKSSSEKQRVECERKQNRVLLPAARCAVNVCVRRHRCDPARAPHINRERSVKKRGDQIRYNFHPSKHTIPLCSTV